MKRFLFWLVAAVTLCSCSAPRVTSTSPDTAIQAEISEIQSGAPPETATPLPSYETTIHFANGVPQFHGDGAVETAEGIRIQAGGTYTLQGNMPDGTVAVNAPGTQVNLILDQVQLSCTRRPALHLEAAESVSITIGEGDTSIIRGGGTDHYDSALYTSVPLTIGGNGQLEVIGTIGNAVTALDNVTINNGSLLLEAYESGISANGAGSNVLIAGGDLYIDAQVNGIQTAHALTIENGHVYAFGGTQNNGCGLLSGGSFEITGGTVWAAGADTMLPDDGSLPCFAVNFTQQKAGTTFVIRNGSAELAKVEVPAASRSLLFASASVDPQVIYTLEANHAPVTITPIQ